MLMRKRDGRKKKIGMDEKWLKIIEKIDEERENKKIIVDIGEIKMVEIGLEESLKIKRERKCELDELVNGWKLEEKGMEKSGEEIKRERLRMKKFERGIGNDERRVMNLMRKIEELWEEKENRDRKRKKGKKKK